MFVPGWGINGRGIPGSDGVDQRTRVSVTNDANRSVTATVHFDCPLIAPIVGPMIASASSGLASGNGLWWIASPGVWQNGSLWPTLTLNETVVLPKPYLVTTPADWP